MEQQRYRNDIQSRIQQWEKELSQTGEISDEAALLSELKQLYEDKDSKLISQLLTIASLSRLNKVKEDSLGLVWMQKAQKLDPQNIRAAGFLAQYEWKNKETILTNLSFPPLRETDNSQTKKQTAEKMLEISRQFLDFAEEDLDELQKCAAAAQKYKDTKIECLYTQMADILQQAIEESVLLLKATEEYKQSMTGVFYSSAYYSDMKAHIEAIEKLKEKWHDLFLQGKEKTEVTASPLSELQEMIGIETVKERVKSFYRFLAYQKRRKALGFQTKDELSLHMILTGNPGTGKTTLARLLAKIYHYLGVLPREEVIEADRSQLVGGYVGQTEENVRAAVEKALGGVLFIDEAYSLKREGQSGNDYGQAAIDTLVSLMTGSEYAGKFAVILAGYPEEMRTFLDANPGLRSRFPHSNHFHLPDYSNEELIKIAEQLAVDNDYILTAEAKQALEDGIERERVDDTFGNARTVRNLVLDAIFKKGSQANEENHVLSYTLLEKEDFEIDVQEKTNNPHDQLAKLIGLKTVKEEVSMLISFVKMQQIRRKQGLPAVPIQLHSVFSGNPGTGKTTVAKIYAESLKECGMLKRGHVIVASRADLVAGFIGQTAIKTKKKIREALGGVLFIDEAYSLFSNASGDFGKEAIDTLVDEMTKHNENLAVILAGYPNEMETLLQSNPGLQSRFKKFFRFPDYSGEELLEIIRSYAGSYQYMIASEAIGFLQETLKTAPISGNGRFATNLTAEAIQSQASRIMSAENAAGKIEHVSLLIKEDFETALKRIRKGEF